MTIAIDIDQDEWCYLLKYGIQQSNAADKDDRHYLLHSNALISADNDDRHYPLHSNDLISFQRYNWLEEGTMNNIVMSVFGLEVRIMTTATATVLQTNSLIHEFKKCVHGT